MVFIETLQKNLKQYLTHRTWIRQTTTKRKKQENSKMNQSNQRRIRSKNEGKVGCIKSKNIIAILQMIIIKEKKQKAQKSVSSK